LTITISPFLSRPTVISATNTRTRTPTCVAARPIPGAAYIVSIMSSMSRCSPSSNTSTGAAGWWSRESP
jgi:hypothetical protein